MFISPRPTLLYKEIKIEWWQDYMGEEIFLYENHKIDSTLSKMYKFKFAVGFPVERKE